MISICAAIPVRNQEEALQLAKEAYNVGCSLIEYRLDYAETKIDLSTLTSAIPIPKIMTLRSHKQGGLYKGSEEDRITQLLMAIQNGFEYVDVDITSHGVSKISEEVQDKGGKVIASFHDFKATPSLTQLRRIFNTEQHIGDLYKIVTRATSYQDNLTILSLQSSLPKGKGICFTMGTLGVLSRVFSPLFGAPFTYASPKRGIEVAPGQLTVEQMIQIYNLLGLKL